VKIRLFLSLVFVMPTLAVAAEGDAPLTASSPVWAARSVIYWGAPALAAVLSLIFGVAWHAKEVRKQYANWPGPAAPGTFGSLCGVPLTITAVLFISVAALFLYIYFGSPETLDEWQTHQRLVWWSLPIALAAAVVPWTMANRPWRRS
jgi:hypothetical protein